MKAMLGMMTAPAAAFTVMAFVGLAAPAAQAGEFCMTDSNYMRGCGYATMEQCQASASGKNGSCGRDPFYDTANAATTKAIPRNALAYAPKPRHRRHAQ